MPWEGFTAEVPAPTVRSSSAAGKRHLSEFTNESGAALDTLDAWTGRLDGAKDPPSGRSLPPNGAAQALFQCGLLEWQVEHGPAAKEASPKPRSPAALCERSWRN